MDNIIIRIMDLPVPGVTALDSNGDYNVYINARLSVEQQRKVADHEMRHINKGHFYSSMSVINCEKEAG